MKLVGYLKASELTSKQRKALGNADFEYDFARNRHAAMFFSLERLATLEKRDCQPTQLIKAESITSPFGYYQWTEKQLQQYSGLALIEIDPEKSKFKTIKVYRTDILDQIEFTEEELKKVAENRNQKAQAKLLEQEQLQKLALLKQQSQDVIRSQWNRLTKLAFPCFELINEAQALAKDYRMRIVPSLQKQFEAKRIQEIANDILIPTAKKGPWPWKFKSMEQLELIIEEFYAIWNCECEERFINYVYPVGLLDDVDDDLDDVSNQELAVSDRR